MKKEKVPLSTSPTKPIDPSDTHTTLPSRLLTAVFPPEKLLFLLVATLLQFLLQRQFLLSL